MFSLVTISSNIVIISSSLDTISSSLITISSNIVIISSSLDTISSSFITISSNIDTISSSLITISSSIVTISSSIVTISSSLFTISSNLIKTSSSLTIISSNIVTIAKLNLVGSDLVVLSKDQFRSYIGAFFYRNAFCHFLDYWSIMKFPIISAIFFKFFEKKNNNFIELLSV